MRTWWGPATVGWLSLSVCSGGPGFGCAGDRATVGAAAQRAALRRVVRELELQPLSSPPPAPMAQVALGQALFFDPELSGNRDQACASCHHPSLALGDGRSLAVGTGSVERDGIEVPGPDHTFIPRNTPPLFNLGQPGSARLLWDGRVEATDEGRFVLHGVGYDATGVHKLLPADLQDLVAAQAMLPVLVRDELRGEPGERDIKGAPNELALIEDQDFEGVWQAVMARLLAIEAYRQLFAAAYPQIPLEDLHFTHAAHALAAFFSERFTLVDSPWDRFLGGADAVLPEQAVQGALLFYGAAGCAGCHSGSALTDQRFHNIGVRPMGSGPSDYEFVDYGAAHRSHVGTEARFAFRTPPLRNVARTGPWMHNGCYTDLAAVIRHHRDPLAGLRDYDPRVLAPEIRSQVHRSAKVIAEVEQTLSPALKDLPALSEEELQALLAFLEALTSPSLAELVAVIPEQLPSGLPRVDPPGVAEAPR